MVDMRVSRVLVKEGLQKLRLGRFEDASRIFNAGLKFTPENAQIHYLNGLTYHLLYLRGNDAAKDLAATGYEMALSIEPANYAAALQLGRLEFEAKRYPKSVEAYRLATDIEPNSGEAFTGLAMAAKRRPFYFVIYGMLCILLALNVAGCHQILKKVE